MKKQKFRFKNRAARKLDPYRVSIAMKVAAFKKKVEEINAKKKDEALQIDFTKKEDNTETREGSEAVEGHCDTGCACHGTSNQV